VRPKRLSWTTLTRGLLRPRSGRSGSAPSRPARAAWCGATT